MSVNQDVRNALEKASRVVPLLMNADVSQWKASPAGIIDLKRLRADPSWVAMRDVGGLMSVLLANFEMALERAALLKDPSKAAERFSRSMTGEAFSDGYFTDGSLAVGVIDTAVDVGLLSEAESAVLKRERPWNHPASTNACAQYVREVVGVVSAAMDRIESLPS